MACCPGFVFVHRTWPSLDLIHRIHDLVLLLLHVVCGIWKQIVHHVNNKLCISQLVLPHRRLETQVMQWENQEHSAFWDTPWHLLLPTASDTLMTLKCLPLSPRSSLKPVVLEQMLHEAGFVTSSTASAPAFWLLEALAAVSSWPASKHSPTISMNILQRKWKGMSWSAAQAALVH